MDLVSQTPEDPLKWTEYVLKRPFDRGIENVYRTLHESSCQTISGGRYVMDEVHLLKRTDSIEHYKVLDLPDIHVIYYDAQDDDELEVFWLTVFAFVEEDTKIACLESPILSPYVILKRTLSAVDKNALYEDYLAHVHLPKLRRLQLICRRLYRVIPVRDVVQIVFRYLQGDRLSFCF